jgi:hypothetical protein
MWTKLAISLVAFTLMTVAEAGAPARADTAIGVNTDITWGISRSAIRQEVRLIKRSGVSWVRASVDLAGAEYARRGRLNPRYLSGIDHAVRSARKAGLHVLLEFERAPYWASADPSKHSDSSGHHHYNPYYRYANEADYANIASALVRRYAAMGVHAYEVWNEPNNPAFWPSGVDAAQYTALLRAAYPAIKAADPSSTVLPAGLMNQTSYDFLQGMYNAGARGSYDAENFHLYPGNPNHCNLDSSGRQSVYSFCLLDGLRAEMTANADPAPVWLTEIGWSTCTTRRYCYSRSQQAGYLTTAFRLLRSGRYPYVQNTLIYQLRNNPFVTASWDWGSSLGLVDLDFGVRPAYKALQQVAGGLRR